MIFQYDDGEDGPRVYDAPMVWAFCELRGHSRTCRRISHDQRIDNRGYTLCEVT